MAYLSLYRKYRPQTFAEILGQQHVSVPLANAIVEGRVAHAYLFTGPRGTGKTSTARILAKAINCERGPTPEPCGKCASCVAIAQGSSLDVIEMDAASHSKVDETREVLAGVPLATAGGRRKVYVIDEVHMLSTQAFNALLKTLEEPPPHVIFVLATTEAHKVLPTIVSRTQRYDFRPVPLDVLETHLGHVAKTEGIELDPGAISVVARRAEGSVRDALSALEQLASFGGRVSEDEADRLLGQRWDEALVEIFDAIARGDFGLVLWKLQSLIAQGADARQLAEAALEHARSLLFVKTAPDADAVLDALPEDRVALGVQAERFAPGELIRVIDLVAKSLIDMRNSPNHRLLLEVALIRAAAPETDPSATGLLGRIERLERRIGIETEDPESHAPARPQPAAVTPAQTSERPAPRRPKPAATPAPEVEAPSAPPVEPVPPVTHVPATVGFGHVKDSWKATLAEVSKNSKKIGAFLNPSQPLGLEDDLLTVEVQSAFHVEAMSEPASKEHLAEALYSVLGVRPKLEFVERQSKTVQQVQDEADYSSAEQVGEAVDDPVELVKRGFSAEVVEEIEGKDGR